MRLGYCFSHPVVNRLLGRLKLPWNVSGITVAAAIAVLDDQEEFESRMARLRQGRAYLSRELARIAGLEVVPSEGNFVLVDTSATGVRADAMVAAMLSEGVLIRSLAVHHASRSFVRVTVGDESQNTRCVDAMRRVINRTARPVQPLNELSVRSNFDAE
jgi:histidinol-phosphate aminotransferase